MTGGESAGVKPITDGRLLPHERPTMSLSKIWAQIVIVLLWAVYVVGQLWPALEGIPTDGPGLADGTELISTVIEALPIDALVLPTALMVAGLIGVELLYLVLRGLENRWA